MLDERMGITQSGDDGQLAIAGRDGERRNPARHRLHDEVQDGFANCGETCRVRERSSQSARGRVERPWRTAAPSRPTQFAGEPHRILRRSCPVPLQQKNHRSARRSGQADERPVVIVRVPQIDAMTERQTRDRTRGRRHSRDASDAGRGSGFDGHHPGALVLAGDRGLCLENLADKRDDLSEELTGSRGRRHTMRDLEQGTPLLGGQPPMPTAPCAISGTCC